MLKISFPCFSHIVTVYVVMCPGLPDRDIICLFLTKASTLLPEAPTWSGNLTWYCFCITDLKWNWSSPCQVYMKHQRTGTLSKIMPVSFHYLFFHIASLVRAVTQEAVAKIFLLSLSPNQTLILLVCTKVNKRINGCECGIVSGF